jgi:hypothetical protein
MVGAIGATERDGSAGGPRGEASVTGAIGEAAIGAIGEAAIGVIGGAVSGATGGGTAELAEVELVGNFGIVGIFGMEA